jgi:hypothetical protein
METMTTPSTRTYTLEKQHLEGPPTLYQVVIRPEGIVFRARYSWTATEWGAEYPLDRAGAAEQLRHSRRMVQTMGGYRLYRGTIQE